MPGANNITRGSSPAPEFPALMLGTSLLHELAKIFVTFTEFLDMLYNGRCTQPGEFWVIPGCCYHLEIQHLVLLLHTGDAEDLITQGKISYLFGNSFPASYGPLIQGLKIVVKEESSWGRNITFADDFPGLLNIAALHPHSHSKPRIPYGCLKKSWDPFK